MRKTNTITNSHLQLFSNMVKFLVMKFLLIGYGLFLISCSSSQKDLSFQWPSDIHSISRSLTPSHDGIDIPAPSGSKVYASHKGTVVGSRYSSSYGKFIIIENGLWATLYAHLSRSLVKRKDKVHQGQLIGYSGSSGAGTGPHLHFELLKNKKPINPLPYLQKKK